MKHKTRVFKVILFIIFLVLGAAGGYFIGKYLKGGDHFPGYIGLIIFLSILPVLILVIAIHEAGHAVAGVWVGFDFRMYIVGPFMWEKENKKWLFKWNKNVNTAGGLVLCLPKGNLNLAKRFTIYAAGGPLASLLLAIFTFLIYIFIPKKVGSPQIISLVFIIISFFSFLIFLVTAVPIHSGGFYSDGARIFRLLRGGDAGRLELIIMKIITDITSGIRPAELSKIDLDQGLELAIRLKDPFKVHFHGFLFQVAFDRGDMEQSEKHLTEYIQEGKHIPAGLRNAVWLDAAFFYAFGKKDLITATHYWIQFKTAPMIPKALVFATEAAMAILRNEVHLSRSKIADALKELPNMLDKGLSVALKDKLEMLKIS